jgi:prefoldin subunit 5
MNDDQRRKEILQAEEAIRQLAREMAHVVGIADTAEDMIGKLAEAAAAVATAKAALEDASRAAKMQSDRSAASLENEMETVRHAEGSLRKAEATLSACARNLDEVGKAIADRVQAAREGVCKAVEDSFQALGTKLSRITSVLRWTLVFTLVFAVLTTIGAGAIIILLLTRPW